MKKIPWRLPAGVLILILAVFCLSPALSETFVCTFRLLPAVDSADRTDADGFSFIGVSRGRDRSADLLIPLEGRSPDGRTMDLAALLKDRDGRVLQAFWRVVARDVAARANSFALWPEGRPNAASVTAENGWNLWDVTGLIRQGLEEGGFRKLRLQAGNQAARKGAAFDLAHTRIYVTLSLSGRPYESSEDLITDSPLLDAALSALPADHWALRQYQEITGSLMTARWPETGVPYYYGGHSEEKVLHRYHPMQESNYYKSGRLYLCGFDCGSFLHWAEEKSETALHDDLNVILSERADTFPFRSLPPGEWSRGLQPGDMLVFSHGSFHAGLYLGTPRMFGLTEANAPDLAGFLDFPLMIHCGEDPFVHDRFRAYIDAQQGWRMAVTPPDGGVTVSLLTAALQDAPYLREAPWQKEYGYFTVMGQTLTVFPVSDCREIAWLRVPDL